jgi:hypothetical protein
VGFAFVLSTTPRCKVANEGHAPTQTSVSARFARVSRESRKGNPAIGEDSNRRKVKNGTGERKDESPPKHVERFQEQHFTERHERQQDEGIKFTQGVGFAEFGLTQFNACAIDFVSRAVIVRKFPGAINSTLGEESFHISERTEHRRDGR